MDLSLSLGDSSKGPVFLMPKTTHKKLCFDVGLRIAREVDEIGRYEEEDGHRRNLSLFPLLPVSARSCSIPSNRNGNSEGVQGEITSTRVPDVKRAVAFGGDGEEEAALSSPNSTVSSFHVDFNVCGWGRKEEGEAMHNDGEAERTSLRAASDDDDNGFTRKKLRLTKEQSAFLEESFKEHNTLNPKQKLSLAKRLNLSPRQVEVWFQNRRARTKLKQTEVDCEYLKKCCDTLTEENRRLQKELQELRALKNLHPFYMQLPATTLTMCPSCERIASTAENNNHSNKNDKAQKASGSCLSSLSLATRPGFDFS